MPKGWKYYRSRVGRATLPRKGEKNTILHKRKKKKAKDTAGDGKAACIFSDDYIVRLSSTES